MALVSLGVLKNVKNKDQFNPLRGLDLPRGRPTNMPLLNKGQSVYCGYDRGSGELLFKCQTLQDMQELYDNYANGDAVNINWYNGPDPVF